MTDASSSPSNAYGRFSEGLKGEAYDVQLVLAGTGLVIHRKGAANITWPYATLAATDPITPHAVDAVLTSPSHPGAKLFAAEAAFVRQLAKKAPHLSLQAQNRRHLRKAALALGAVAASLALIWAAGVSPARWIADLLPDKTRIALGKEVIDDMAGQRRQCETPAGRQALDRLTKRLSAAAGPVHDFKIVVSDWDLLNAFAAPGEQIVLARGLIDKAETPDELAGVLAHEMGHGIERHPETSIVRNLGLAAALQLLVGGGSLVSAGAYLAQLSYSRSAEREADVHALRILKDAGIAAQGLGQFFRRVMAIETETPIGGALSKIEVLRSHPMTTERIATVEASPGYPATPALDAGDWAALKGICAASAKPKPASPSPSGPAKEI